MDSLILASSSKRRQELMPLCGFPFEIVEPQVKETLTDNLDPRRLAIDLAALKAEDVSARSTDRLILACDTVVFVNDRILGKPTDRDDARYMLQELSGSEHQVVTGCVLQKGEKKHPFYSDAKVWFKTLEEDEITAYLDTREPFGKAGAYAVQEHAAKFVERIEGDYYAIMGLPVAMVYRQLRRYQSGQLF